MLKLEEIIEICQENFNLKTNVKLKGQYLEFLQRQLIQHPEYDLSHKRQKGKGAGLTEYPWANLLVDKLLLCSYMIGETAITVDYEGRKRRIGRFLDGVLKPVSERKQDLYLLSTKSIGAASYRKFNKDKKLLSLLSRQNRRNRSPTFQNNYQSWSGIINELCKDPLIVAYFGQEISYKKMYTERR